MRDKNYFWPKASGRLSFGANNSSGKGNKKSCLCCIKRKRSFFRVINLQSRSRRGSPKCVLEDSQVQPAWSASTTENCLQKLHCKSGESHNRFFVFSAGETVRSDSAFMSRIFELQFSFCAMLFLCSNYIFGRRLFLKRNTIKCSAEFMIAHFGRFRI